MAAVLLLRRLDGEATGLFYLYYQPLVPLAAMVWAWASLVAVFEARSVQYGVCFSARDQQWLLPARALYHLASIVSAAVATSAAAFVWFCFSGEPVLAGWQPLIIYLMLPGLLLLPLDINYKEVRGFFAATLGRVATPVREVTWADFLLADFLTSLAKPLSDGERAVCHLLTGPVMDPSPRVCSGSSWLVPAAWAAPFAWRFCQCLRVYRDTGAIPQLWNALKYATAFPVIVLSAAKASVSPADWLSTYRPMWMAACAVNSCFSYFWDVERDWEISWFTNTRGERSACGLPRPAFKGDLLFGPGVYYWLLGSNAVLRLAWLHKLVPRLRRSHAAVLGFALLEVYRRTQWAPVRIEVELRKLQATRPELGRLVPATGARASGEGGLPQHLGAGGKASGLPTLRLGGIAATDPSELRPLRPVSP